ncbi:MAG: GNAT family N-acetyltransferase [Bacteroidia bacterium]|nr:GNAT family N-acetyltransferase [Bacteroidia bacterium]
MEFTHNYKIIEDASLPLMLDQYHLICQLNTKLEFLEYQEMLTDMHTQNYHMLCVFDEHKCVGVSGYRIATKIYCGKYLELDNVVVEEAYRNTGIGKIMCDKLNAIAIKHACKVLMLDAYLSNLPAHLFYEREGFEKKGYHFLKRL